MLSPRAWLEHYPRQLRLFVALLMLLSFVAPTWHVCSLGGHVMDMAHPLGAMAGMKHREPFARSASGALICFCAPRHRSDKFPVPVKAQLNGRMMHDASCLALLLSAMPALAVSPFQRLQVSFVSFPAWFPTRRDFPARELIRTFSGRGPPVCVCISPTF
ncbi:hypothetical protein IAD21_00497 [Abditibacteriota bacterium]|nr:hypothetical protein IAD21_00497 [Abditibacteriota bacterium]